MTITKQTVADQIAAYLHHRITLEQLVDWAEHELMEADFEEKDAQAIGAVISRLGVADVRAFGPASSGSRPASISSPPESNRPAPSRPYRRYRGQLAMRLLRDSPAPDGPQVRR